MAKRMIQYDPFETMFSLRDDLDRMFRDFFSGYSAPELGRRLFPLMDVKETPDAIIISAEVPGLNKKDIGISVKKGELIIKGEKREEKKKEGESFLRIERSYGSFRRIIKLPSGVDESKVKASYKNGVLNIHLPKTEEEKPKEITITVD